jgi:SCP-2 sterol transfer family
VAQAAGESGAQTGRPVATKQQVERKLRELITRMDEADREAGRAVAEALPEPKIIEVTIPDLSATYWTELSNGKMHGLHRGAPGQADIRVRVASDHLVDLVDGKKSLFSSYLGGQVKIEASLSDLLRLRKLA